MKTFYKGPFTSFLGLTSLYLVNIQPNSKLYPPLPKFSGSALECGIKVFFRIPPFPPPLEICWVRPWLHQFCIDLSVLFCRNPSIAIIGQYTEVIISSTVSNGGENAYQTLLVVQYPNSVSFIHAKDHAVSILNIFYIKLVDKFLQDDEVSSFFFK